MGYEESSLIFFLLIGTLCAALAWEMLWPRRPEGSHLGRRWANNLGIAAIDQLVLQVTHAAGLVLLAWSADKMGLGVLNDTELPWLVVFLIAILTLDFAGYLLHLAMHKVPWLWRCHMVHHSDTALDFSSSYRHHPAEVILTSLVAVPVLAVLGPPVEVMVVYQSIRVVLVIWGHANIYIPQPVDRFLRLFLVTPDFHRLHHCSEQRFTDSNYGAISPWFDYLFKTASDRPFEEQRTMEIGLEYFREPIDSRVDRLLLMPFRVISRNGPANGQTVTEAACTQSVSHVDLQTNTHVVPARQGQ